MRYLFSLLFVTLFFNLDTYSQILPSRFGVHTKKSSGGAGGEFSVDLSTIGNGIVLSNNNKTITSNLSSGGCDWRSVYLSPPLSVNTGVKSYTVTIDSYQDAGGNGFDMVLGVVISNSGGDSFAFLPSKNGGVGGFGYVAQTGQKYGYSNCVAGNSNQNYGASYGQGDVIKIEFDTDNKTLTFYKNNVSQGIAYTSGCFSGTTFHFAITICNTNFTVTKD